ncbi:MAG: hypothetical protein ACLSS9_15535 [Acutalibacteraceae bacterium]
MTSCSTTRRSSAAICAGGGPRRHRAGRRGNPSGDFRRAVFDHHPLAPLIYAPASFAELETYLRRALFDTPGIAVVRHPKGGELPGLPELPAEAKPYILLRADGADTSLVTYGRIFGECRSGAANGGEGAAGFGARPADPSVRPGLRPGRRRVPPVIFFEEGSPAGGVAEHFGTQLTALHYTGDYRIQAVELFILTCKTDAGLRHAGLMSMVLLRAMEAD